MCCVALVHQVESSRLYCAINLCMHIVPNAFVRVCTRYVQARCTVQSHMCLVIRQGGTMATEHYVSLHQRLCSLQ